MFGAQNKGVGQAGEGERRKSKCRKLEKRRERKQREKDEGTKGAKQRRKGNVRILLVTQGEKEARWKRVASKGGRGGGDNNLKEKIGGENRWGRGQQRRKTGTQEKMMDDSPEKACLGEKKHPEGVDMVDGGNDSR